MSEKYTAESVEAQAALIDASWLDHHDCSICGRMVGYILKPHVAFRGACDCSWSPDRPSSYYEIADWLAMQPSDEIRDRILTGFHA